MTTTTITHFQGEFRFLSNFWRAPVQIDGVTYPTAEHAYQAAKCVHASEAARIATCYSPGQAKRLGRIVTLRPDWEQVKIDVMREVVQAKFTQNADLCRKLLATSDSELIEGNDWGDTYWGVCGDRGLNHLGKLLMQLRSELADVQ